MDRSRTDPPSSLCTSETALIFSAAGATVAVAWRQTGWFPPGTSDLLEKIWVTDPSRLSSVELTLIFRLAHSSDFPIHHLWENAHMLPEPPHFVALQLTKSCLYLLTVVFWITLNRFFTLASDVPRVENYGTDLVGCHRRSRHQTQWWGNSCRNLWELAEKRRSYTVFLLFYLPSKHKTTQ